jgi:hypothetical protein
VVDEKAFPDISPGVDFNPGAETADMRNQAREKRYMPVPQGMSQAVELPGMKAGIGKKYLTDISGCRVMLEDRLYIPPDAPDKLHFVSSSTRATA